MNTSVASYITSAGLKAVTSAGVHGPYFAIKYFLPIYDYRIDKTISREISGTTSATSISALNLVSATHSTLFGEKIYRNGNYTTSNNSFLYWNSNMGSLVDGTNLYVPSRQSVSTDVTFESGKPLSIVVSGSNYEVPQKGFFNISGAHQYSAGEVSTYNPLSGSNWPLSAFYRVAGYTPNANGLTSATGTFNCRIPPSNNSFKFNGLALYAVKVDGNGFDDYGNGSSFAFNPTLISVVLFDQAQYISNSVGGINDFSISVDLGFDWNVISSGASATPVYVQTDNWTKLPTSTSTSAYGLAYDGDVVLSNSAIAGSYMPRAKMTIVDPYQVQLRLGNDNDRFSTFRTIRFANNLIGPVPNNSDRAVLSIDTSCPEDSLLQLGDSCSAIGVKSVAVGWYSSATGFDEGPNPHVDGGYSVAIGVRNYSAGFGDFTIGKDCSAIGYLNFAGGESSIAKYYSYDDNEQNGLNFAYGKFVSAISRQYANAYFNYVSLGEIFAEDESYGSNIAFGVRSLANGGLSFVNGTSVSATGVNAFCLGYKNLAKGHFSFVGGINSYANSDIDFVIGSGISANSPLSFGYGKNILLGEDSNNSSVNIGIGDTLSAIGHKAISIGSRAISNNLNAVAIGQNYDVGYTYASGQNSLSIGLETSAFGTYSISIGQYNLSNDTGSISIGSNIRSLGYSSIGLGDSNSAVGNWSFASNYLTSSVGAASTSFGFRNIAKGDYSLVLGNECSAIGVGSIAAGFKTSANGNYSLVFGNQAKTDKNDSIALGHSSKALYERSVAIGYGAETSQDNEIVIGSCDSTITLKGSRINIGGGCNSDVTIPGIKQFNDSMKIDFKMVGSTELAQNNPSRTLELDFYRSGTTNRKLTLVETGYNTNRFLISNVQGIIYAMVNEYGTQYLYKLESGMTVDCSRNTFNYYNNESLNMIISIDKALDYLYISNSNVLLNGNSITDRIDYNVTDSNRASNAIYIGKFDNNNSGSDEHTFLWMSGINMIKGYINYDKQNVGIDQYIFQTSNNGDGLFTYDLYTRTLGEHVLCRVSSDNDINSQMWERNSQSNGLRGTSIRMTGMVMNVGGYSLGTVFSKGKSN